MRLYTGGWRSHLLLLHFLLMEQEENGFIAPVSSRLLMPRPSSIIARLWLLFYLTFYYWQNGEGKSSTLSRRAWENILTGLASSSSSSSAVNTTLSHSIAAPFFVSLFSDWLALKSTTTTVLPVALEIHDKIGKMASIYFTKKTG